MKKVLILFSMISIAFATSYAQSGDIFSIMKGHFLDGEFFLEEEEYLDALPAFTRVYNRGFKQNANINYRMGICYLNIPGKKDKAIVHLELAATKVDDEKYVPGVFKQDIAPLDAFLYLGNAYRLNNELDKAITAYNKYKSKLAGDQSLELIYANQQIEACNVAKSMLNNPVSVEWNNLGEQINTARSNFRAVISGDENHLLYVTELSFYDAIFYATKKDDGTWDTPRNITPEIRSDGDLYPTSISFYGSTLFMVRQDNFNSDIWYSTLGTDGRWTAAEPLGNNINSKFWESHACMSADGQKLYFTSNRGKKNSMSSDIYVADWDEKGGWTNVSKLDGIINTNLNEESPYITADGKTLFFSSQGHSSMGGYDVFYSTMGADGSWSKPQNVGYPINTTDDDVFFHPINNGGTGLMSVFNEDSFGKEDIYLIKINNQLSIK